MALRDYVNAKVAANSRLFGIIPYDAYIRRFFVLKSNKNRFNFTAI